MMDWNKLLSSRRYQPGSTITMFRSHDRSQFQRDYDRLIFSSPFRRLQNKTQVFPLPGNIFVHNRLTHSLEVASVGRSLGNKIAQFVKTKEALEHPEILEEIGTIVSTACLAHDLGNPPFGHSGEEAISYFFTEGEGQYLKKLLTDEEWADISHFEGNANAFRLLTHSFNGRRPGGYTMTFTTLASIVKYPFESKASLKGHKYGFFQSEKEIYKEVAEELGIIQLNSKPLQYVRHPLVYLVEAADDICYQIMDIEDACKLHILTTEEAIRLLLNFFEGERLDHIVRVMKMVDDTNEQIAYLRSCIIGLLVDECSRIFLENEEDILSGTYNTPLIDNICDQAKAAYDTCSKTAYKKIYRAKEVLDIELAGYHIFSHLIDTLTEAVMNQDHAYSKLLLQRIPEQYDTNAPTVYGKVQCVLDYISGMTDVYALDLYRKITGMSLPAV